jgi:hypothetical protein
VINTYKLSIHEMNANQMFGHFAGAFYSIGNTHLPIINVSINNSAAFQGWGVFIINNSNDNYLTGSI